MGQSRGNRHCINWKSSQLYGEDFGDLKIGGRIINKLNFADDMAYIKHEKSYMTWLTDWLTLEGDIT